MKAAGILILLMTQSALAGEPIDFSRFMIDLDGKNIPISDKDPTPISLGRVAEMALLSEPPSDPRDPRNASSSLVDKTKRFDLALRIHNEKKLSLSSEDTTLLKQAIADSFAPIIVGQAVKILDPTTK